MPLDKIPFDFIFDYLLPVDLTVKKMFGMVYLYIGTRLMLMLRNRANEPHLNGIWVATDPKHVVSLRKEVPSLMSFSALGIETPESKWQLLSPNEEDFETSAITICNLISRGDKRIGRVVKGKSKK
jgi:hypothetical protein